MKTKLFFTSLIVLCFASCSIFNCKNTKNDAQLIETYWKLVELSGEKIELNKNPKEAHIILKNQDDRIIGNGGCNSFSGSYELSSEKIRFSKVVATKMACMNMEIENKMFQMLENVTNYTISGDTLQLFDAQSSTVAKFEVVYLK